VHLAIRSGTPRGDRGFTLIELLVVVVIIGALVAIAVPLYLNYRKGAADKAAQSDIRGAIGTVEKFYADNDSTYPATKALQYETFSIGGETALRVTLSDRTGMTLYVPPPGKSYKICTMNLDGNNKQFLYDSAVGGSIRDAVIVDENTCAT
jgi:type IV pilus assembly protein PilA